MSISVAQLRFDLKKAVSANRLLSLWKMMSGFQWHYVAATASLGVAAITKTFTPLLIRYFIDNYISNGTVPFPLPLIALGFVILAIIEGAFSFLSGRLTSQTSEGITRRLRNYLFDHIQRLNFTYHDKTQTGELIQRCTSDVDAVRRFYADQAIGAGRVVLLFVINFIAICQLSLKLGLVSVVAVPFVVITSAFFFKRVSKTYDEFQKQDAILTTTLQENLSGVRVVKAFARQVYEINKFEKENKEKYNRGRQLNRMHAMFWPASDILCGVQTMIGILVGALMTINGEITIGTLIAYMGLVGWIIWPMRNLGRLIVQTSTGIVSVGRVLDIIKEEREPLDSGDIQPTDNVAGKISFEDVDFHYQTGSPVLQNISFECQPGQAVALLGSTGSGKTTLVNLLPRFYEYTGGHIWLDGVELNRYTRRYLRKQIGIVEQEPFLFSRTIRENITYGVGREVTQEEVEGAAKAASVHNVIMTFPKGYDTLVGERGVTLSGGQKQRVAIARTLLKDPRILILDDSTSSVDTETEAEIRDALQTLMKNRTTFIIAHRIQSIMDADLILVLDKGKIVQRGSHDDLLKQDGIYKQIYEIQTRIEAELEKEIADA